MKKKVVGMGEALWDVFNDTKKIGGAPANFAYHVKQFGLDSCVVSAVGRDAYGDEIIENFNNKGLDHLIEKVEFPTGTVQVTLTDGGIPHYEIKENVAWDNIPFTPALENLARETGAVCFGSLAQRNSVSRDTIVRFLEAIPAENKPLVVFDINLRQHFYSPEVLKDSMHRCNILKINDEEMEIVDGLFGYNLGDQKAVARRLMADFNLGMLILTCGEHGSWVFTADSETFRPTPVVVVNDTVGAGDSFTGAFIASLLKGKPVANAHAKAVETSAYVCTQPGAMPAMPAEITA